jgi:hypothetical protein
MRLALALLACCLVLSGCSSNKAATPPAVVPSLSSPSGPPPPPPPTSDTLHLMAPPEMLTALPSGGSESATPVGFGGGNGPGQQQMVNGKWSYLVKHSTNVTGGEAHIWVNVKETLIEESNPAQPQCSWRLVLAVGSDNNPITPCINEATGPVNPGIKELVFALTVDSPIQTEANETVTVQLQRSGFSASTNNAVDLLSGSSDHDSRIQLKGLKELLPKA